MTPDHPHHTSPGYARSRFHRLEGAALIIVLSCLVLVTTLIIGFLSRSQTERGNSVSYRGGTGSRNLADYAVNVVMAQIRAATTGDNAANAWASQPGAIRVYESDATLVNIYKLYSAPDMMVSAFPADDLNLTGWSNNTALYTDLNAPVVTGSGTALRTNYPILDPGALGVVQGFAISGAPNPTPLQPIPMPVTWLYVLEDGTLVAPTGTGSTATVIGATSNNPITGRIAFWTDDDTCKININTASGAPWNFTNTTVTTTWGEIRTVPMPANYWDTPMSAGDQDRNLATVQPWAGEYQRFPGHPATVSLSAVFTNLTTNDIMAIAPRITYQNGGVNVGSQWGSFVTVNGVPGVSSVVQLDPPANNTRIADDASRLYANVDELLFATNRSATGTNPVTPQQIELARFFLTASSRAPDVTLFNTPRLLCWPITFTSGNTTKMTPYDQLIAFCGTVGGNTNIGGPNSYYFTRWNPDSPTADYNVSRNQTLLGYFRRMTTTAVPGFGGSSGILGKYNSISPGESEQITTEIFDYIRCINTRDMSMATSPTNTLNQYTYAVSKSIMPTAGANNTLGFGRFPTVTKVGVHFWFDNYFTNVVTTAGIVTTNTNVSLCCRVGYESFIASQGYPDPGANFSIIVDGIDTLTWGVDSNTTSQIFTVNTITSRAQPPWLRGGRTGFIPLTSTNSPLTTNPPTLFSTNPASTFYFGGGNLKISVRDFARRTTHQVINVNLPPTTAPMPLDTYTTNWGDPGMSVVCFNGRSSNWVDGRNIANIVSNPNPGRSNGIITTAFRPEDVVRAVAVSHGDFRLIAANPTVSTNAFVPVNGGTNAYFSTDPIQRIAHNFVMDYPYSHMGARFPMYNYYNTINKSFTTGTTNANATNFGSTNITDTGQIYIYIGSDAATTDISASVTGDFDNGYGNAGDGPYIGFADEGNLRVTRFYYTSNVTDIKFSIPYIDGSGAFVASASGFFSPNRLVPSAGIMGSLPTGVISETPWQTLLFRPAALTSINHPGLRTPPDYLLLDLFNMPVVEPYAISEPLSTAGRVNMNYQILPFTYIKRSTALQAALHTERLGVIPNRTDSGADLMTNQYRKNSITNIATRLSLNLDTNTGTLRGFENRFGSNDIFRSAAEICSIPLVPTNSTWSAVSGGTFWPNYSTTGENTKERPYARIYPKLTTKSNTYTVHYRVEVLKKRPNTAPDTWTEGQDKVLSTYRGSTTIERYVNPRDPALPDYATLTLPVTGANALPNFYKFRVVGERQFNP